MSYQSSRKEINQIQGTTPNLFHPCSGKVLEQLSLRRPSNYLSTRHILASHQSGFRTGHSTEHALVKAIDDSWVAVDRGRVIDAVFIDLLRHLTPSHTTSFSTRWDGEFNAYGTAHSWLPASSQINSKEFPSIRWNPTSWLSMHKGVPQGSLLGPIRRKQHTCCC